MATAAEAPKDASKVVVFLDHGKFQGHFIPTLAVADLFVRKGYSVHYFASEIVQQRIESTGAIFQPYDPAKNAQGKVWDQDEVAIEQVKKMGYEVPPEMREHLQFYTMLPVSLSVLQNGLASRIQQLNPEVIFANQFILWGHMIAELLQVPLVYSYSAAYIDPNKVYETYGLTNVIKPIAEQDFMQDISRTLLKDYNLDYNVNNMFRRNDGYILCYTIPEFDPGCAEAVDHGLVHCAGPSFPRLQFNYEAPSNENDPVDDIVPESAQRGIMIAHFTEDLKGFPLDRVQKSKQAGDTIIYCSMGTIVEQFKYVDTAPLFKTLVEAYGNKPKTLVVCSIGAMDESKLPAMPSNFIWQSSVPQKSVLELADVFISHMGNNSTNEALFMGCPIVCIPLFADQTRNAARVDELGLGIHIPNPNAPNFAPSLTYVSEERLVGAIDEVLGNASFRQRCQDMKRKMRLRHLHFQRHGVEDILEYATQQTREPKQRSLYPTMVAHRQCSTEIITGSGSLNNVCAT